MDVSADQKARLGRYAIARRDDLGATQQEIANRAGVSTNTVRRIEAAAASPAPASSTTSRITAKTLRSLSRALRWEERSAERILAGGEPIELAIPALDERTWTDSRGRVWKELAERGSRLTPRQEQAITDAISRLLDGHDT
ncbi:hypothetical protein BBK14_02025 [Parafrankia soli]|uniref:RNA polymerase sigma-70 region 4 domain-containing protein n=1 Tax=Parafrankia soli TaxID=2599596 RepID=A0A1S1RIL6_9ACTN|nr:sigma factor-like helix-turn-helix DNA-binding protein [Parafrankia soli]OHV46648.1 hypothetical protein BBK14_02025 [Parafrankia soli]